MDNNIDTSVDTNVDSKEKVVKLSITDYAIKNGISTSTVRNWIRSGKVEWEKEKGKYVINNVNQAMNIVVYIINYIINYTK